MDTLEHVAIIMDGNGRHGERHVGDRVAGHINGAEVAKKIILHARALGIPYLSMWAFSTANWKRSRREVAGIMGLVRKFSMDTNFLMNHDIRLVFMTLDTDQVDSDTLDIVRSVEDATRGNKDITVIVQLNYDGLGDVVAAQRLIAEKIEKGIIGANDITPVMIKSHLLLGQKNIPDPDLVIRTGGRVRMSNYMMLNIAESELVFFKELWPEFTEKHLDMAINMFLKTTRNFGDA